MYSNTKNRQNTKNQYRENMRLFDEYYEFKGRKRSFY